jgi:hypothetical protein
MLNTIFIIYFSAYVNRYFVVSLEVKMNENMKIAMEIENQIKH